MSNPGPIQPGANPAKGPGEPSEEVKKGRFKEELQKVQKISKTDEDSQAKKKKKQSQGDVEEEDASAQAAPLAPPPGFTLHETKTTSVYDAKSGTVQEKQIDATSPTSKMVATPSKGLLGSQTPVTSSTSSSQEETEEPINQPTQNTPQPSSSSAQTSTSETPTQPQQTQEQEQEQEPSPTYTNAAPAQDQINTQDNQSLYSQKASSDETSSLETDHKALEKLKKDIEKLEKQIKEFEEKGKADLIPELLTKKQALFEKGLVLEKTLKKVLSKQNKAPHEKEEKEILSKSTRPTLQTKEVKQATAFKQKDNLDQDIEAKTPSTKEPIDAFEEKPQTFEEKKILQEKPILNAKQQAAFDHVKTADDTSLKPLTPLPLKGEKAINPDEKVEALLKKQAKEKKKKIEETQNQSRQEAAPQDAQTNPLTPLQMAPQAPEAPAPSGTLSPKMHELFQTMVGLVMIKNLKTEGLEGTRTEVTLNNPEYAKSPFYNLKIVITEYQTAPGAYNIELQGNSQQNTLITPTLPKLLNAFADPRTALPFTVNRLEVTIKKEDAEKRVKKVQSTTSGQKDFDDTPG
jgi:hypothetical protein